MPEPNPGSARCRGFFMAVGIRFQSEPRDGARLQKLPHFRMTIRDILQNEWRHLVAIQPSERPWQLPFVAALTSGLPLAVGAWFGHMDYGLISSLGGLVFLYTPNTALPQRMAVLMMCGFGMSAGFALAQIGSFHRFSTIAVLTALALLVSLVTRFYRLQPPGALFFIMAAAIGAYMPHNVEAIPLRVGLLFMGSLLAVMLAFFYSLYMVRRIRPLPAQPLAPFDFQYVVYDSVWTAAFTGLSLVVAHALEMPSPYWVPVSCVVIMQNMSMRALWNKQVHRILGTFAGMVLAWGLLRLEPGPCEVCLLIMLLTFATEFLVVRHYGMAVIFITPMTILLAEAGSGMNLPVADIIQARVQDIVLGSVIGLIGGVFLHEARLRAWLSLRLFGVPFDPPARGK